METKPPIWNQVHVAAPPVCTVKSKWCREVRVLNGMLKKITSTLDSLDIIQYETKLLSAILKKLKGVLRMDKIYQFAGKVIQCVKKCGVLNLKEVVLKIERTSSQCTSFDHQPSRQMLEYTLIRILGFINLLKFLVDLCHKCALHLKGKMQIGHLPAVVLTLFSIVSRIWSVSKYFLENAIEWYLVLLPSLKFLEPTQIAWLPSGFEFPALPLELEQVPWINQNKILTSLRSFLSDFEEPSTANSNLQFLTKVHDLGETISREDFAETQRVESRIPTQKEKISQNKNILVRDQPKSTQKSVPNPNKCSPKSLSRKRKLLEDDNSDAGKGVEQPAKRVFKTKFIRTVQKPQASKQQVDERKTLEIDTVPSNLVKKTGSNNVAPTDIMQELTTLKQDLAKFSEQSKFGSGINSTLKQKVVVVQDKTSSVSNKTSLSNLKTSAHNDDLKSTETSSKFSHVGKTDSEKRVTNNVNVISHARTVRLVGSDSSQKKVSKKDRMQKLLEKRKEMVALKKQKSKSWVIS